MWLLIPGVILVVAALAGVDPVAGWPKWVIASPFALAAAWWVLADRLGFTHHVAGRRAEQRIEERKDRMRVAMGLDAQTSARLKREQEVKRAEARQQQARLESSRQGRDALLRSSFTPGDSTQFVDTVVGEPRPATGNRD